MTSSARFAIALCLALLAAAGPARAASVYLEALTWTELRARVQGGATTALVPVGGTEQSGPHMALGKHNVRARLLAGRIAEKLGNAIVAPVLAYVPEGTIEPPTQHMKFPGTLSVAVPVFEALLADAARSLRHAGFRDVVFLGEHGGYVASLEHVADRLNREWRGNGRAIALTEYYRASQAPFAAALKAKGISAAEIGMHAGIADTSLMLALDPSLVRMDVAAARPPGTGDGVTGDPRRASAELGRIGVELIVDKSVAAIRAKIPAPH
jgi:creatinine amidohydrolase/Fe(II)-dependent formamide hydrolase-like protein